MAKYKILFSTFIASLFIYSTAVAQTIYYSNDTGSSVELNTRAESEITKDENVQTQRTETVPHILEYKPDQNIDSEDNPSSVEENSASDRRIDETLSSGSNDENTEAKKDEDNDDEKPPKKEDDESNGESRPFLIDTVLGSGRPSGSSNKGDKIIFLKLRNINTDDFGSDVEKADKDSDFLTKTELDPEEAKSKKTGKRKPREIVVVGSKVAESSGSSFYDISIDADVEEFEGSINLESVDRVLWGVRSEKETSDETELTLSILEEEDGVLLDVPGVSIVFESKEGNTQSDGLFLVVDADKVRSASKEVTANVEEVIKDADKDNIDALAISAAKAAIQNNTIEKINIEVKGGSSTTSNVIVTYNQKARFLGFFSKTIKARVEVANNCVSSDNCEAKIFYEAPWWLRIFSKKDKGAKESAVEIAKKLQLSQLEIFKKDING